MSESEKAAWAKNRTQAWRKAWIEVINNMSADSLQIMYEDREDIITLLIDNSEIEDLVDTFAKKRRNEVDASSWSRLWQKLTDMERDDLLDQVLDNQTEEDASYYTDPKLQIDAVNSIVTRFEELAENEKLLGNNDDDDTLEEDD